MKVKSIEEALLAISEGVQHSARNPNIKHYVPHEKQAQFHKSTKKKKLYIGGNRSGKTFGGVAEAIWRASCRHPFRPDLNAIGPNRGRVAAVSFTEGLEKINFPIYKQLLYPSILKGGAWETAYDKTLRTLTFDNDSTIEFMSYDQDLEKFAGTSRHWIHFDEEPPKSVYMECMARLIDTDGDFWVTMTPVEGMTWVYDDLYENHVDNPESPVEVIEIATYQNPYLKSGAVQSFIDSTGDDDVSSRIEGKFVAVGGRIYKEFDPTLGGPHVISPVDNPKEEFKDCLWIMSLDHGMNNPTAVYWTAIDAKGVAVTFKEYYQREKTVKEYAADIKRIERELGREPDLRVADPSIKRRDAVSGTSIHEEYVKNNIVFTLGNNDVKAGLIRFRGYLKPSPVNAGLPMWRITADCPKAIWELKKYRYKVYAQKKLQYENNAQEEPQKKDDHACDSLRYMIMTRPDLRQDNSFADQVEDIAASLGAKKYSANPIADPFDLQSNPNINLDIVTSPPSRLSEWEFDEHMGGIW